MAALKVWCYDLPRRARWPRRRGGAPRRWWRRTRRCSASATSARRVVAQPPSPPTPSPHRVHTKSTPDPHRIRSEFTGGPLGHRRRTGWWPLGSGCCRASPTSAASLDEGLLSLTLSKPLYTENPYSYKKCR
jgi:hypothetical protein